MGDRPTQTLGDRPLSLVERPLDTVEGRLHALAVEIFREKVARR